MLFLIQAPDKSLWLEAGVSALQAEARFVQHHGANEWAQGWIELDAANPLARQIALACIAARRAGRAAREEYGDVVAALDPEAA